MVIASGVIDRRHLSPFGPPSDSSSSFFSEDLVPTERQVGFWKSESMVDQKGSESFFASPLEKVRPMGADFEGSLQHQGGQVFKGLDILSLSNLMGQGNTSSLPSISWDDILTNPGSSGKSRIMASGVRESADTHNSIREGDAPLGSTGEIEAQTIGDLLPSDDDFISGIIDGFEFTGLSTNQDDADEDIFCTGGGIELENDDSIKGDKFLEGSFKQQFSGEYYINKYPSRTLIVRNINASIEDSELRVLFQRYGDIHMLHTSCKNHGFVTVSYYDIRAAQNAIRALHGKPLGMMNLDVQFSNPKENVSDKDIKVELGHPGEARSCLRLQCSREWKQVGSPHQRRNSPPETVGKLGHKSHEGNTLHNLVSPVSPQFDMSPHGICTNGPQKLSSPIRIESSRRNNNQAAIGGLCGSLGQGNFGGGMQAFHPHSLPDCHSSIYNSSNSMPSNGRNASFIVDGTDYSHLHTAGSGGLHGHSFDQNNEAFGVTGVGSFPLHRHHYTWNNSNAFPQSPSTPMMWSNLQHPMHMHGYPGVPSHTLNTGANPMEQRPMNSAPNSGGSFGNAHSYHPGSLGNVGFLGNPQLYPSDLAIFAPSRGNYRETVFSPVGAGLPSMQQMSHAINGRNPMIQVSASYDATNDRMRSRRHGANAAQPENKRQFELDIDRIAKGEDTRTTLMLKNIPNKYNCKLILDVIDENHRGTYDFIYLPIDFKNKCNVGYAFINMTNPQHIIPFYKTFNGKKWEKFNSEKVASLAYARIQGRSALISHFQNSSLMNEDKWCRPILFHKDGPNAGDQEPFPVGNNVRSRPGRNKPLLMPERIQASSISPNQENSSSTSPNEENFSRRATEDSVEQT